MLRFFPKQFPEKTKLSVKTEIIASLGTALTGIYALSRSNQLTTAGVPLSISVETAVKAKSSRRRFFR